MKNETSRQIHVQELRQWLKRYINDYSFKNTAFLSQVSDDVHQYITFDETDCAIIVKIAGYPVFEVNKNYGLKRANNYVRMRLETIPNRKQILITNHIIEKRLELDIFKKFDFIKEPKIERWYESYRVFAKLDVNGKEYHVKLSLVKHPKTRQFYIKTVQLEDGALTIPETIRPFIISTPKFTFTVDVSENFSEFESHIELTKRVLREAREAIAEFERLTATL